MSRVLRDPSYMISLAVLGAVLAISVALGRGAFSASTPNPQATIAQVLLDWRRLLDLDANSAALEMYRARYGVYPSSEGFTTFCSLAYDPGCLVTFVTTKASASDGTYPYWYWSDGKTYTLFARVEMPIVGNRCPDEVPPPLADTPVFCLSTQRGTP